MKDGGNWSQHTAIQEATTCYFCSAVFDLFTWIGAVDQIFSIDIIVSVRYAVCRTNGSL